VVTYDLIVVGGGPAGATCARKAAMLDLEVLILEKAQHPRRKACGGGVTVRVLASLDFDLSSVIERKQHGVRIYSPSGLVVEHSHADSSGCTVRREDFDNLLLREAEKAGAHVIEGEGVVDVKESDNAVAAITDVDTYSGRLLVGADGVNSIVGRQTGILPKWDDDEVGLCIEASVPMDMSEIQRIAAASEDENRSVIEVHFGPVLYEYAWAFAKECEFSLGIGVRVSKMDNLKGAWKKFVVDFEHRHGVDCDLTDTTAARLPLRGKIKNTCSKRIMLVGDAAGLVAPVTGEGIYYAIESGKIAAEVADKALLQGNDVLSYEQQLRDAFGDDLKAAESLSRLLMKSTKNMELACQAAHGDTILREHVMKLVMGMCSYNESRSSILKRMLLKHPGKALQTLF